MDAHNAIAKSLEKVWENKDFNLLDKILSKEVHWYEGSFEDPLTSPKAVIKQWQEDLSTQNEISVKIEVMMINGHEGIYHCRATWTEVKGRELDGVFDVKLDTDGLINYFNSWWTEKLA